MLRKRLSFTASADRNFFSYIADFYAFYRVQSKVISTQAYQEVPNPIEYTGS